MPRLVYQGQALSTLADARAAIEAYRTQHHPELGFVREFGMYDLFPHEECPDGIKVAARYPDRWQEAETLGLYALLDIQPGVLYVGKSDRGRHNVAGRLWGEHVRSGGPQATMARIHEANFIVVWAVQNVAQIAGLEVHLIQQLHPPYNRQYRRRTLTR
jgi:hypothetical protein